MRDPPLVSTSASPRRASKRPCADPSTSGSPRRAVRLVAAAFSFLCEALPPGEPTPKATQLADTFRNQLAACLDEDESGRPTLTVKLPDRSSLDALANALGRLLAEHSASAVP